MVSEYCKNCRVLQKTIVEQAADLVRVRGYLDSERKTARESIAMLRQEFDDMSRYAAARESKITPLQTKVEELETALKDIYQVTNDRQVMSIVMANLPQPKTIPAALKEDE